MDATSSLLISSGVIASGVVIAALEDWKNRKEYSDDGLMSHAVSDLNYESEDDGLNRLKDGLFGYTAFRISILFRIIGGLMLLLLSVQSILSPLLVAAILAMQLIRMFRCNYGGDGADHMTIVVLAGLAIAAAFPEGDIGRSLAMWFITLQLIVAYVISGIVKVLGPSWRDGSGILGVLSTHGYGCKPLREILHNHRSLALILSWSVILFEVLFFMILLSPPAMVALFLLCGVLFHLGIAFSMGLNNFVFAFLAPYSIVWCCISN